MKTKFEAHFWALLASRDQGFDFPLEFCYVIAATAFGALT